ncbi:MAG: heat-inducible transcriptional repressor HrcA [Spirulina sp. SIO3F2]|nr:heat-inducible transcriptional repressor HrcA [Spirulina sp. SIO3F2]
MPQPVYRTLNERQQRVLWATIRHYVATAEPVGSKTLAQEYDLQVSSATIRNAMGSLEKVGLLYQPHTSAGRIPSDSGYRVYVDKLITPETEIGQQAVNCYTQELDWASSQLEHLLQQATQILATLSGYIALVTLPQNLNQVIRHLHLAAVGRSQIMLILVTDAFQAQSIRLDLPELEISETELAEELQLLSNFLDYKLRGQSLASLKTLDWRELDQEFQRYASVVNLILEEIWQSCQPQTISPILIQGVAEALRQPEFAAINQVQTLLQLLEKEQDSLFPLLFDRADASSEPSRVMVRIGAENPIEPLTSCALVAANYHQGTMPIGSVGLLGPTRMLYENAIAIVESTANYLSGALSETVA